MADIDLTKAAGRALPPPDDLVEAAYQVITEMLPGEDPVLYAILHPEIQTAGVAAEAMLIGEVVERLGTRLGPNANPLTREGIDKFTLQWANRVAHESARQITEATMRGIAQTVAEGLWREAGVHGTARNIRLDLLSDQLTKDLGRNRGLTTQRVASVEKERVRLMSSGVSGEKLEKALDKFAKKQLNDRARVIAQDQMRQTTTSAQRAQADRYGAKQKRSVGPMDDRTRDECRANVSQGWIPIDSSYASGTASAHQGPNCRHHDQFLGIDEAKVEEVLAELEF